MSKLVFQIISLIMVLTLAYYFGSLSDSEAVYMKSDLTNEKYLIQNFPDKDEAIYMLGTVHKKIFALRDHLSKNIKSYPEYKAYIEQFCERIQGVILQENPPDGSYTSYTDNKGEKIALCIRSRKDKQLHDMNLVTYVVIHELAHVACPEKHHTELFKKIFIFLLKVSIDIGIYKEVDYSINPHEYCGISIRENLLAK